MVAEKIGTLDRRKRTTAADPKIWYIAIIESDWYKPRVIWGSQSQLLDR